MALIKNHIYPPAESTAETPFEKGAKEWDNRMGKLYSIGTLWRFVATILGAALILCLLIIMVLASTNEVKPYYVEIDAAGNVNPVGEKKTFNLSNHQALISKELTDFVLYIREIPNDPVVLRNNLERAGAKLSERAKNQVNAQLDNEKLLADVGKYTRQVSIKSVLKRGEEALYQIQWIETKYDVNGNEIGEPISYTGIFNYYFSEPLTHNELKKNPIGFYIDEAQWTQEFSQ